MADTVFVPFTPEALATAAPTSSIDLRTCRHDVLHTSDAGEGDVDLRLYYDRFTPPLEPNAESQRFTPLPIAPLMIREGIAPTAQRNGAPATTPQLNGAPATTPQLNGAPAPTAQRNGTPATTPQLKGAPATTPQLKGAPARVPQLLGPPPDPNPYSPWYEGLANEPWVLALPFEVPSLDITNLPIVGGVLPPELALGLRGLALVGMASGIALRPDLYLANQPLRLPALMLPQGEAFMASTASTPTVANTTVSTSSIQPVWWADVKKPLGPLDLRRLGIGLQDKKFWLMMDAALQMGQLKLIAIGLGLGIDLEKLFAGDVTLPSFNIDGLGVEVRTSSGTTVGGVLVRQRITTTVGGQSQSYDGYAGAMVIQTKSVALSAVGSFESPPGADPSFFAYGTMNKPLGGPPFFYVTGLSLGLGVNTRFKLPDVDRANEFPLVKRVPPPSSALTAPKLEDVLQVATELRGFQERAPGNVVLALGVDGTSFGIVNTSALLLMTIADDLELDLIGQSTFQLPPDDSATRIADVRVNWRGHWSSNSDSLWIRGMVRPGSWAFHRRFALSGELAFEAWTRGPHAGDFVFTVGGYAPSFSKPAHYPSARRLAIGWSENAGKISIEVKGEGYCAITPSMLMTGGRLSYSLSSGDFRAWLTLGADFELHWNPFRYRARMSVEIGAEYTLTILFVPIHMRVSVGAELELWGPDLGGKVKFSLLDFIDVEFTFGADDRDAPALTWTQFRTQLLPKEPMALRATNGLVREDTKDTGPVWVVSPDGLAVELELAVPATKITQGDKSLGDKSLDGKTFAVRPMKLDAGPTSSVVLTIKDGSNNLVPCKLTPLVRNVPAAQWGATTMPKREPLVPELLTGVSLTEIGVTPGSIETLSVTLPDKLINGDAHNAPPGKWVNDGGTTVDTSNVTYAAKWAAAPTLSTRTALLRELYDLGKDDRDPMSEHRTAWIEELQTIPTLKTKTMVAS